MGSRRNVDLFVEILSILTVFTLPTSADSCPIKSPNCSCILINGTASTSDKSSAHHLRRREILNCNNIQTLPRLSPDPEIDQGNLDLPPLEIRLWNVQIIPANAFNGVRRGQVIFSRSVELSNIHSFAFNNSRINIIRFESVPNLTKIDNFAFTGWKSLSPSTYACRKYLTYLDHCQMELRINSIGSLQLGKLSFSGIQRLEHLYLASRSHPIESFKLDPDVFHDLGMLKILELYGKMTGLEPEAFAPLKELHSLRIRDNRNFVPKNSHFPFPQMDHLELISVDLSSAPDIFFTNTNKQLRKLSMSDCSLSSLPCSTERLTSLEELDISKNNLDNFPTELWGMKYLKVITTNGEKYHSNSFICNCSMYWVKAWPAYHTHGSAIIAQSEQTPVFNCPGSPFGEIAVDAGSDQEASNLASCTFRSCMRLLDSVCTEEQLVDPIACRANRKMWTMTNKRKLLLIICIAAFYTVY